MSVTSVKYNPTKQLDINKQKNRKSLQIMVKIVGFFTVLMIIGIAVSTVLGRTSKSDGKEVQEDSSSLLESIVIYGTRFLDGDRKEEENEAVTQRDKMDNQLGSSKKNISFVSVHFPNEGQRDVEDDEVKLEEGEEKYDQTTEEENQLTTSLPVPFEEFPSSATEPEQSFNNTRIEENSIIYDRVFSSSIWRNNYPNLKSNYGKELPSLQSTERGISRRERRDISGIKDLASQAPLFDEYLQKQVIDHFQEPQANSLILPDNSVVIEVETKEKRIYEEHDLNNRSLTNSPLGKIKEIKRLENSQEVGARYSSLNKGRSESKEKKKKHNRDFLCNKTNEFGTDLVQAITEAIKTLPRTNIHLVFEVESDGCLLEAIWSHNIAVEVLEDNHWWMRITSLTYIDHSQHVLVGSLTWIIDTMQKINFFYTSSDINAMNTRWIWVSTDIIYSNTSSASFAKVMEEVTRSLQEGVRGILIAKEEEVRSYPILSGLEKENLERKRSWVKIASIEAAGDGSWFLSLSAVWNSGNLRTLRPFWPPPSLNFQNRTVRIACIQKPRVFEHKEGFGLDEASGYIIELLLVVRSRLNFTDILVPTEGFGLLQSNGSWNGMVGVLQRQDADMAALDFTPSLGRTAVVEFSKPIGEDIVVIISKAPSMIIKPFLLLQIFSPLAWVSIVGAAVITGVILDFVVKVETSVIADIGRNSDSLHQLANVLKIFVYQSSTHWPQREGSRLVASGGILLALIIGSLYSGSITAFLAIPFRSVPINSATDLVRSKTRPALRSKTLVLRTLTAEGGAFHEIRDDVGVFTGAQTTSWEFFKTVADGTFGLVDVYSSAVGRANIYEKRGARCQFYLGKEPVKTDLDVFAFAKNSPILHQFDDTIQRLRYFGLMQFIKDKYFAVPCEAEITSDGPQPMSITQAQGAIYVWFFGLVLGLLAFVLEILWARIVK